MRRPVGVKWVLLFFRWTRFFSGRVSHCRHPSIRTLVSGLRSLGASWAFSFQPVLLPDCRPFFLFAEKLGQAINAVTGTRRFGLGLSFLRMFLIPLERQVSLGRRVYLRQKVDIKLNRAGLIVKQAGLLF